MSQKIYHKLLDRKKLGIKTFAVLIDPDKVNESSCIKLVNACIENHVELLLVGGSVLTTNNFHPIIQLIKHNCQIPLVIFPGHSMHLDPKADGILFLSLISGRNPDFLIGQHVVAAPMLKKSNLEILPTGYLLIDSGKNTTAAYISNTTPIPHNKPSVAACTAMAGEMLGLKLIYLDAGSGAKRQVSTKMISLVSKCIDAPLLVGGGINSLPKAVQALDSGADILVMGNGIEKEPGLLIDVAENIFARNQTLNIH